MSAIVSKHEPRNGLRALIDELYARRGGGGGGKSGTQYAFVYRPGGGASYENVYTDWPSLYAAISLVQGPKLIQVDDSFVSPAVVPAGTYDLSAVTFASVANYNDNRGTAALQFASGVHLTWGTLAFEFVDVTCEATTDMYVVPQGVESNLFLIGTSIQCQGAGRFVSVSSAGSGGFLIVFARQYSVLGDGTNAVIGMGTGLGTLDGQSSLHVRTGAIVGGGVLSFDSTCIMDLDYSSFTIQPSSPGPYSMKNLGALGNGVADDSGAYQRAFNAFAGIGVALTIPTGIYIFAHPVAIPNAPLDIYGSADAVLKSTMPPSGSDPTNCIFIGSGVVASSTTFAANNVVGASTISMTAAPSVGAIIQCEATSLGGLRGGAYKVTGVAGGGPFTVTVDRPVLYQFTSGDSIFTLSSRPTGFRIFGNGLIMGGTGDRYIELSQAVDCLLQDIVFDGRNYGGAVSVYAFSFDVPSYNCHAVRCEYDGGGTATNGCAMESAESCTFRSLRMRHVTSSAYQITDCVAPMLIDLVGSNAPVNGLQLTGEFAPAGTSDAQVIGGLFVACGVGVQVDSSSARNTLVDVNVQDSTSHGLHITTATDTKVVGGFYRNGASTGILVDTGSPGTVISEVDVSGNAGVAINLQTSAEVTDVTATACGAQALYVAAAGVYHIGGVQLESTVASWEAIEINNASARVYLSDAHVTIDGNGGFGLLNAAGVCIATGLYVDGAGAGNTGCYVAAGATTRLHEFGTNAAAPLTVVGGGFCNRKQTVVANGATPVAVAFPDIESTDVVQFTEQTPGGTPGNPRYTITGGTGFSFVSDAGDTSTYEWYMP